MTRGQKPGFLDKATLAARLGISDNDAKSRSKQSLLAQAVRDQKVSPEEVQASCAIRQSTTPMYLHSVCHPSVLGPLEKYVQAWSRLYRRGSFLANYIFMKHNPHPVVETLPEVPPASRQFDPYQPRIHDTLPLYDFVSDPPTEPELVKAAYTRLDEATRRVRVARKVLEAKIAAASEVPQTSRRSEAQRLATERRRQAAVEKAEQAVRDAEQSVETATTSLGEACVQSGWRQRADRMPCLKQVFLPEFWPTSKQDRHAWVDAAFQDVGAVVEHMAVPDWDGLMTRSGWSQVLNRMGDKYAVNVAIQATAHLYRRAKKYVAGVRLAEPSTRPAILGALNGRMGVLTVHDDDYAILHTLRTVFGADSPNSRPSWNDAGGKLNPAKLDLHLFFTSQRVVEATPVPVANRRRHFAYVDQKIALALLPASWLTERKAAANKSNDSNLTLGEAMALTPNDIRQKRKLLRQQLRRKYRGGDTQQKKKLARKWKRTGWSNVPKTAMFASMETDGVGLRLCIGTPLELTEETTSKQKKTGTTKKEVDELTLLRDKGVEPVFVGTDGGRAKLTTSAISECAIQKPRTDIFTRGQYYWEMHHAQNNKFEVQRRAEDPDLDSALLALAESGGIKNTDWTRFMTYLDVERAHWEKLEADGYIDRERALWRQRLFRYKRSSLDRLANRLISAGDPRRPLVLGYGDAGFAPTGRGEKSVPTSAVTRALLRAKRRSKRTVVITGVWEFRTTLCCCACGGTTCGATLTSGRTSRRLRLCTHCNESGDKRRDRDVQAARNILWLLQYMYYGADRPEYMCRGA
jgi:hypothetical protein